MRPAHENHDPEAIQFPSTSLPISDLAAVDEVLRGNREMFEVIVRRYNPQLYRVGMAYLRNHAKAEDAMQNAYLRAFLNMERFKRTAAFSTWLTRIMINECLMTLRKDKPGTTESLDDGAHEEPAVTSPACDTLHNDEMKTLLEAAISALPETYRAVYVLREVQQFTTAETAESLGITQDSVKVILHRARARLKEHLLQTAEGVELFSYPAQFCNPMTERVLVAIMRLPRHSQQTRAG